jgi:hypothetical protein
VLALCRDFRLLPLLAAMLAVAPAPSHAQAKLDARYEVTLAGIPIGKGNWSIEITDNHYKSSASGGTAGLLRVFSSGHGNSSAQGTLQTGQPMSSTYSSFIASNKKNDEINFTVTNGVVKESRVEPPLDTDPERVPITDEHRNRVPDPRTATPLHAPATGAPQTQQACRRTPP